MSPQWLLWLQPIKTNFKTFLKPSLSLFCFILNKVCTWNFHRFFSWVRSFESKLKSCRSRPAHLERTGLLLWSSNNKNLSWRSSRASKLAARAASFSTSTRIQSSLMNARFSSLKKRSTNSIFSPVQRFRTARRLGRAYLSGLPAFILQYGNPSNGFRSSSARIKSVSVSSFSYSAFKYFSDSEVGFKINSNKKYEQYLRILL